MGAGGPDPPRRRPPGNTEDIQTGPANPEGGVEPPPNDPPRRKKKSKKKKKAGSSGKADTIRSQGGGKPLHIGTAGTSAIRRNPRRSRTGLSIK